MVPGNHFRQCPLADCSIVEVVLNLRGACVIVRYRCLMRYTAVVGECIVLGFGRGKERYFLVKRVMRKISPVAVNSVSLCKQSSTITLVHEVEEQYKIVIISENRGSMVNLDPQVG